MTPRTFALGLGSVLALATLPGCIPWWLFENDDGDDFDPPPAAELSDPPSVGAITIPSWPPPGPNTEITVTVSDDVRLTWVDFSFAESWSASASGTSETFTFTGADLGEGYGSFHVIAYDLDEQWADQEVTGLLVDLSPPKGQLVKSVFRRGEGEDVQLWVGDAWVLGGAELKFEGQSRSFTFEPGYPSTLGVDWDTSIITLPTTDFPEGAGKATLRVWDAAGNQSVSEVDLTLDGTPPVAAITSPAPKSVVSGLVTIEVTGADEGLDPVQIDVFVAGTPVATLPGPAGKVTVDVSELAKGGAQIEAVARDAAGNTSDVAAIDVVIE